jgi:hypothetical protein
MRDFLGPLKEFVRRYVTEWFGFAWLKDEDRADLEQSAFTVALELEREREHAIDFSNADDQAAFKKRLQREWRQFRGGRRRGPSFDESRTNHDGGLLPSLAEKLPGRKDSDPLEALAASELALEREAELMALRESTYSQFAAYLTLLLNYDWNGKEAAAHLAISLGALNARTRRCYEHQDRQPSLFDRLLTISRSFWPKRRIRLVRSREPIGPRGQAALPLS